MLIDTHTHLYVKAFNADRDAMIARAMAAGVERFYLPAIDSEHIDSMLELEAAYPDNCQMMIGLHPCSVGDNYEAELAIVKEWLDKRPFCAIGEIGLDLYWDKTFYEQQSNAFRQQIRWAKAFDIPIVIHSREATDEAIAIIADEKDDKLRGIFHCFGGSLEQAQGIINLGFHLGIGGVLTYKKSGLDEVLKHIDMKHIVLETDAPYLAPVPHRGKRNESAYIRYVAEHLATVKGISLQEVEEITSSNALGIFEK